ncbi:MAG TPA: hypothetical protein VKX46_20950 [Ktedonobacteraceae bacterium]|jgi:hypothetical protein|nr:hypothetical protein [Ktedonobacteraceae bacterium]
MDSQPQEQATRIAREQAYRRGWQQGMAEATIIIFQLLKQGYPREKLEQLFDIYQDEYVSVWRHDGDLTQMEPFPAFDIEQLEAFLATHPGYGRE